MKITLIAVAISLSILPNKTPDMKPIKKGQTQPVFETSDVYDKKISSSTLKGRKTVLSFQRNVGCPVCNLHFHQMLKKTDEFKKNGIDIIFVYQSNKQNLKSYLDGGTYPFAFIADPENKLYNLFSVKPSFFKLIKGTFHGSISKMKEGKKLFTKKVPMEGDLAMAGAEFLIDPEGRILLARYRNYVGDHLSEEEIINTFN